MRELSRTYQWTPDDFPGLPSTENKEVSHQELFGLEIKLKLGMCF